MSERTCSNCSATIPDGAQFCTTCGTPAPVSAPAPAAGTDNTTVMAITPPPAAPPAWTPGVPAAAPPPAPPAAPAPAPAPSAWTDPTMAQPAAPAPAAYQPPPPAPMPPTQPAPAWNQPAAAPPPPAPQPQPQWQPQAPPTAPQPGPPPAWGAPQPGAPQQPPWPGAAPVATPAAKKGNAFGGLLAFVGAILLLVGAFTPWVRTNVQAGVTGWKVSPDAKTVVALGAVALILGLLAFAKVRFILFRLALIGMGIAAIVITVVDIASIGDKLPDSLNAKFGFGLILVAVGGVFLLLSGLFTKSKKVAG